MDEKRCILCNKPYNYKYHMFGRGCLDNMYELLEIKKSPRFIFDKELYLCTRIAWRNHKFFLNRNKKYILAQKYIALKYLEKMNYNFLDDIINKIKNDIKGISVFVKNIVETITFSLNDIYKIFNETQKFDKIINDLKTADFKNLDKDIAEQYIKSLSFIFDVNKISNPIMYAVNYERQYIFWQVVVIGGLLTDKKFSAKLLSNSLSPFGKNPSDLIIEEEEYVSIIKKDKQFKERINQLVMKYGQEKNEFIIDEKFPKEDTLITFEDDDLLYALHNATMFVRAQKNEENRWKFEIEINDRYDFTDFKSLQEYADAKKNKLRDIFSTLLNNLGVVSSKYGVIKEYNVKIKFKTKEEEI